MSFEELWLDLIQTVVIIAGLTGSNAFVFKLAHKLVMQNHSNYKEIRSADEKNNYSMVTLLRPDAMGREINTKPPKTTQHFEELKELINKRFTETLAETANINTRLDIIDQNVKEHQRQINHIGAGNTLATLPVIE